MMLPENVKAYIEKEALIPKGSSVLVALSGGADSVALLSVLSELRDILSLKLYAAHVHHGLRGDAADRDAAFSKSFSEALYVPCEVIKVDVNARIAETHESLEEAARILRYEALLQAADRAQADVIATAHHRKDQAETILFQLLRGSALRGLSGMQPKNGRIVRPLLSVSKEEILSYLTLRGYGWCEDETNLENVQTRNRIRHRVLPELQHVRPDAEEKLAETGNYLRSVEEYLTLQADAWAEKNARIGENGAQVNASDFSLLHPVMQQTVLHRIMEKAGLSLKDLTRKHLTLIAALSEKPVGKSVSLPGGLTAVRTYEAVKIGPSEGEKPIAAPKMPELRVFPYEKTMKIPENQYTKWFDYDKIIGDVRFRNRTEGDVFATVPGGKTKLKKVLIDLKIPRDVRDSLPLMADDREVIWIIGHRMSENYKITADTGNVLEVKYPGDHLEEAAL